MADEQQQQTDETQTVEFKQAEQSAQTVAAPVEQSQFYREKSSSTTEQKPSRLQFINEFIIECQRVLRITKKPDREELKTIVKVSGLGMLVIGLIGFFIHLIRELLFK